MVEVVAPEHVQSETTAFGIAEQPGVLGLVLTHDQDPPIAGRLAHLATVAHADRHSRQVVDNGGLIVLAE